MPILAEKQCDSCVNEWHSLFLYYKNANIGRNLMRLWKLKETKYNNTNSFVTVVTQKNQPGIDSHGWFFYV